MLFIREHYLEIGFFILLHVNCRYRFGSDIIQVESLRANVPSYSRACLRYFGGSKFLVAHEQEGQTNGKYTCIEVLLRDTAILQIRQAELSEDLYSNLCDDGNLKLNGWLIIDYNAIQNRKEVCSLTGGFNMQVYDKSCNRGVCDGYLGETRLESECLLGEGMLFEFRQAGCVPDGLLMHTSQRTNCIVNWTVGKFKFILLSDSRLKYLWLLRYPKIGAYSVTLQALLMKDLYATKESSIRVTHNYLRLSLSSQISKTLDSLCYDDYEICSVLSDPCSYSEDIARTCAKTCVFCTESSPKTCQFELPITGTWIDGNESDKRPNVNVTSSTIEIPNIETLHCIEWSNRPRNARRKSKGVIKSSDGGQFQEQMLVSVTNNGCRPRYTCAKFIKMDQVFFLHLSQTKLWSLVESKYGTYDCSDFQYSSRYILDDNPYRSNTTNLLTKHTTNAVQCDLSEFQYISASFENGQKCKGQMDQNNAKTSIYPAFESCPIYTISNEYICVEYSTFVPTSDKLLVTKTRYSPYSKHCWLFPADNGDVIYVVEAANCSYTVHEKTRDGTLIPLATITKGHDEIATTPKMNGSSIIIDALSTLSTRDVSTTDYRTTPVTTNNSTDLDENGSDNKPAMAAATVVISVVLVVAALLCKCSC